MNIKELAAEAKKAELAAKKAEEKRVWAFNARTAEATVKEKLGVVGKTIRAHNDKEQAHGAGCVVKLEEGLFVKIMTETVYGPRDPWSSRTPVVGTEPKFRICKENGDLRGYTNFKTLAGLGDALAIIEKEEAERAAEKAVNDAHRR